MPYRHRHTQPVTQRDVRDHAYEPDPSDSFERLYVPPVTDLPPKIVHPRTVAPRRKCYRVIRHYYLEGVREQQWEDIGAFDEPLDALQMSNRERGRAKVLAPNGKVYQDNWHDLETRKAPTTRQEG